MSYTIKRALPTPEEICANYPVPDDLKELKKQRDKEICDIISGKSDRFLLIIGPCSADNEESVVDYTNRLSRIYGKVSDKLMIVPRVYTNKPRTNGDGYKGIVSQPDPSQGEDFLHGLIAMRQMHLRVMSESRLTAADEMLYPENWPYISDILSYVAIGARSVEDQQHRLASSGFDIPAGMKNPTSGHLSVMLNSIYAAQQPHSFIFRGNEVETNGNPYAHAILRGGVNKHGSSFPNYHYEDLALLIELYQERNVLNPACIIDANHNNSGKRFAEQPRIIKEVLHSRRVNPEIRKLVKGVMVESYIKEGCQKIGEGIYGKSITDPCLGWADSEQLIYDIADLV